MRALLHLRALRRGTKILLVTAAALAALVVLFDWNWLRGPVERYYSEKSGRAVTVGHFDVEAGFSLVPTVRLRDVRVENAPWASHKTPFVAAEALAITFSVTSLWRRRPVISRIVLVNAEIELERTADGLRNWRLRNPDNRERGQTRVLVVEAQRSRIRFINHENQLSLTAVTTPLDTPSRSLTTRITFEGTYAGAPFTAEALNSGFISFRESGIAFPMRGQIVSRKTRMEVDGLFTDIFDPGPIDAALRVSGATLAQLHPFVRVEPPPSRPFDFSAQLKHQDNVYRFSALSGKIGETDVKGAVTYDRSRERQRIEANLSSTHADVADLRAFLGLQPRGSRGGDDDAGKGRLFPTRRLNAEALKALDAQVSFNARTLKSAEIPMLDSLRLTARLTGGLLELSPIDLGVGGGRLTGALNLDARRDPPSSSAVVELQDVRLERLFPALANKVRGAGAIAGLVSLVGRGNSLAAMVGNSSGSLKATMGRGRISGLADAKLGLDFGKVFLEFLRRDRDSLVHCGSVSLWVTNGHAKSQEIVLDTDLTHVTGAGTLDLRNERIDILLSPEPRNPSPFTRRASIRIHGPLRAVETAVERRVAPPPPQATRPAACMG